MESREKVDLVVDAVFVVQSVSSIVRRASETLLPLVAYRRADFLLVHRLLLFMMTILSQRLVVMLNLWAAKNTNTETCKRLSDQALYPLITDRTIM